MEISRRQLAAQRDSENTALLASEPSNLGNDGNVHAETLGHRNGKEKASGWLKRTSQRLWNNRMVAAIVLLLLGGLIALCVFFGGMLLDLIRLLSSTQLMRIKQFTTVVSQKQKLPPYA